MGHLTSVAFRTLGTKNLGLRVGAFALFRGGIGPSHIIPYARLLYIVLLLRMSTYAYVYALVKTSL